MKNVITKTAALILALGATSCRPDHLTKLDGKSATASIEKTGENPLILKDMQGRRFFVEGNSASVMFEINRLSASKFRLINKGNVAVFELDKSLLNKKGELVGIPAWKSGQPVDLQVSEWSKVLSKWKEYEHVVEPDYITLSSVDSDGNLTTTQVYVGDSHYYYEKDMGLVERGVAIGAFKEGALNKGFPVGSQQARMNMSTGTAEELFERRSISKDEYDARGRVPSASLQRRPAITAPQPAASSESSTAEAS